MTYRQLFAAHPRAAERLLLILCAITALLVHTTAKAFFFETTLAEETPKASVSMEQNLQTIPLLKAAVHSDPNPAKGGGDILIEDGALVPVGDPTGRNATVSKVVNGEISIYIVREGDTLSQIAEMFDVSAKTILWANDLTNANAIRPGDSLVILPITGVRHIVKSGDTIQSIAKKYGGDVDDILAYNQLASASDIAVGDTVVIPDGTIAAPTQPKAVAAQSSSGSSVSGATGYTHPLPGARRTQGIHGFNGVDLAAPAGTPILAAASGEVIVARASGWNGGYGLYVVIKHPRGTQTLYAHMSRLAVTTGEQVTQGQVIGYVGSTGRSTGDHLHFEVRGARNPF
jgi:LysM repeat protein